MDRISLSQIFNQGLNGILNAQSQIFKTQGQVSSGLRVQTPSDDPIAAAQILQLNQAQSDVTQYQKNITGGTNSLQLEDSQLASVSTLLTRVRELAVQSGDGSLSSSDRAAIAAELSSRMDDLAGLANTRSSSGEYIFAGFQGQQAPFVGNSTTYTYVGDNGQRQVQVGSSTFVPTSDNGNAIFAAVPSNRLPTTAGVGNTGNATMAMGQIVNQTQFNSSFTTPATAGSSSINFNGSVPVAGNQVIINGVTFTFANAGAGNPNATTIVDATHVTVSTDLTTAPSATSTGNALVLSVLAAQAAPVTAAALAPVTPSAVGGVVTLADSRPGLAATVGRTVTFAQGTGATNFTSGTSPALNANATGSDSLSSYKITLNMTAVPPTYQVDTVPAGGAPVATGNYVSGQAIQFNGAQVDIVGTPGNGDTFTIGAPSTQSVFTTLSKLVQGLKSLSNSADDKQRLSDLVSETLDNVDAAETNISTVRAKIGARMNTLQSSSDLQNGVSLINSQVLSQVRDLDYASAISQLTQQNVVLQAAQQSFAKISGLSLFDYLR